MKAILSLAVSGLVANLALASDDRIPLVEMQIAGDYEGALAATDALRSGDEEAAARLGLDYLRGHLLAKLGRHREASASFALAVSSKPSLEDWSRLRIARAQEALGHPEVAAGVIATVLAEGPPRSLADEATAVLVRTLDQGGDCRLLAGISNSRLPTSARRALELARGDCDLRSGETEKAISRFRRLLQEKVDDLPAREAAIRLDGLSDNEDIAMTTRIGRTFHHHREFERASKYLSVAASGYPSTLTGRHYDNSYRLARSDFWQGRFSTAAESFGGLSERVASAGEKAQSLYQMARSLELMGSWTRAAQAFEAAYGAQPTGNYAGAALIGAMRLHWRKGDEVTAQAHFDRLRSRRGWRYESARAAMFLAASDLVRGRTDRAPAWLDHASRSSTSTVFEVDYWRGRRLELLGRPDQAVEHFAALIERDVFHPLSQSVMGRLKRAEVDDSESRLPEAAERYAKRRAGGTTTSDLTRAALLFDAESRDSQRARGGLEVLLRRDARAADFLDLAPVPVAEWPLWQSSLSSPEEQLLALGVWEEGAAVVRRHFPIARHALALSASQRLIASGRVRRGLLLSEVLHKRKPKAVPEWMLPDGYRRALYPFAYSEHLTEESRNAGVDHFLLAAIIRQESRFDPKAVSAVAARGLTQFVYPTAARIAGNMGQKEFKPGELESPEVAIRFGAAYLGELLERYGRREHQVVAAYNAGEAQAELWQSYCYTLDPAEFFTKVTFRETRNYLVKVLSGQAQYRDIYGTAGEANEDPAAEPQVARLTGAR